MTGSARIIVDGGGFFGIGAMPVTVSASEFDFCRTRAATEMPEHGLTQN